LILQVLLGCLVFAFALAIGGAFWAMRVVDKRVAGRARPMDVQGKVVVSSAPGKVLSLAIGLALLGGLASALQALDAVQALAHGYSAGFIDLYVVIPEGWQRVYYWLAAVVDPIATILLIGGAILVIARRWPGQILLTTGCALAVAVGVFGSAVKPALFVGGPAGTVDRVVYLALLAFPIATIVMTWSPSATRRCRPQPTYPHVTC